jgi:hypothetical protein
MRTSGMEKGHENSPFYINFLVYLDLDFGWTDGEDLK